jgi:hypothetical protein
MRAIAIALGEPQFWLRSRRGGKGKPQIKPLIIAVILQHPQTPKQHNGMEDVLISLHTVPCRGLGRACTPGS